MAAKPSESAKSAKARQPTRLAVENAKRMQLARHHADLKARYDPISVRQLIKQEKLAESYREVGRSLTLAALPRQVQTLVENGSLTITAGEQISRASLAANEKIALTKRIIDEGLLARDVVKEVGLWSPATRASFFADIDTTFKEARERHKEESRQRRVRERERANMHAAYKQFRDGAHDHLTVWWVQVSGYNEIAQDIPRLHTHVDQERLQTLIPELRSALENTVAALEALAGARLVRADLESLSMSLDPDEPPAAREPTVVQGEVVGPRPAITKSANTTRRPAKGAT